jgi:hypothetical protein
MTKQEFIEAVRIGVQNILDTLEDGDIELMDNGGFRYITNLDSDGVFIDIEGQEN